MTEFITRNYGNKEFEVIIKTDSEEHYKETQDFARKLIGHAKPQTNADRIRAMSDEELAEEIGRSSIPELCDIVCGVDCKAAATFNTTLEKRCADFVLDWLQMPAEEADNEIVGERKDGDD